MVFRQSLNQAKLLVDEAFVTPIQSIPQVTMSSPDATLEDGQKPTLALETTPDPCFAPQHTCPIRHVLDILSSKWSVLLLREFLQGPRRTSQLREALPGISSKTLAANLHTFEHQGLLYRQVYAEVPLHVEYHLTAKGQEIRPLLVTLHHLGTRWLEQEPCICPVDDSAQRHS